MESRIYREHPHKICFTRTCKIKTILILCLRMLLSFPNKSLIRNHEKDKPKLANTHTHSRWLNQRAERRAKRRLIQTHRRRCLHSSIRIYYSSTAILWIQGLNSTTKQLGTGSWGQLQRIKLWHRTLRGRIRDPIRRCSWPSVWSRAVHLLSKETKTVAASMS